MMCPKPLRHKEKMSDFKIEKGIHGAAGNRGIRAGNGGRR